VLRALAPLLLALAAPALSNTPMPPPKPFVLGEVHTLPSRVLGQERRLTVRLPSGYAEKSEVRYPVMYVVDGGPEQDFRIWQD
jgi:enterochelin esterase-like enzyme